MNAGRASIFLHSTSAWCSTCRRPELARIVAVDEGVFMERMCPGGESARVKLAADRDWYLKRAQQPHRIAPTGSGQRSVEGCPLDCGLCERHTGQINLPVFSITNDCNLNCPICFTYNRPDRKYYKTIDDCSRIISNILEQTGGVDLINLTGGEPTLHPHLFEVIAACRKEGIGRITMNTNGLRLAGEKGFAEKLKESGVQVVLSLDTLNPEGSRLIHGRDITEEKRRALELLETFDIPTTILPVCIKGINEEDVAEIVRCYFAKDFVRSVTIQTMTYTGRYGSRFEPRDHITLDEVETLLSGNGGISRDDFFAPGSAHPLCYSTAYYIIQGGRCASLTELIPREKLVEFTSEGYLLRTSAEFSDCFREGVDRLWANGRDIELLNAMREFLKDLYQGNGLLRADTRHRAERWVKMLCIHAHMDQDNFDLDRICRCGDVVPDESGQMVPACSYNLFYRQRDSRFWVD